MILSAATLAVARCVGWLLCTAAVFLVLDLYA
ncbi:hypothetical protein FHR83_007775 [Actinoplanes campanulatus]|uniref:Uncharacterized protein n=1 Tax=Actinoplanes campanulatus TaxID=113559 RepID=A0A7W5APY1_9ACTN|nr:hypothetical protein [Actinoplanes campanulatus]